MAADRAPGLLREHWGFTGWLGHEAETWEALLDEADERAEAGLAKLPPVLGSDSDPAAVAIAEGCARRAGLASAVELGVRDVADVAPPEGAAPGLVVTNPPYGRRLEGADDLPGLYALLGERLREGFSGWKAALLTAEPDLGRATRLRAHKAYTLFNGAVETRLYLFDLF
jgi:23S rRNA (guanine2445-N2)-methyltransferase / 23S rRNA (guanine2069-N7)-methyltransferase